LPEHSITKFRLWDEQGRLSTTKTPVKRGRNRGVFPIILDEREEIPFKASVQGDKPTLDAILATGLSSSMAYRFGAQYIAYKQGKATPEMMETLARMSQELDIKIAGIKVPKPTKGKKK
jgi:hypothetical protein